MSKRLLFVDDDCRFREVVLAFLQGRGFEIVQAPSGNDAELEMRVSKFDLLIVDGQLPDFDGVTLIRNMRALGDETPVIFVSGAWKDTDSYRLLTEELKVAQILHKPVPPAVLADHIEKVTGAVLLSAKEEKVRSVLEQLAAQYALDLPDMILDLCRDLRLGVGNKQRDYLLDASRKAHKIKGSSGSYGFTGMSAAMETVEDLLHALLKDAQTLADEENGKKLLTFMADCKSLADHIARTRGDTANIADGIGISQILLLAGDSGITKLFDSFVSSRVDTALTLCSDEHELLRSAGLSASDLVFMEVAQSTLHAAGELCKALRSQPGYADVPIVFISADDLTADCDATCNYFGAVDIIYRPLDPQKILVRMNELVVARRSTFPKVVMFDDDRNFVRRVEMALNCDGLCVVGFTDTSQVDAVLEHAAPNLVLLDVDMPKLSGFEVCRRIRTNPKLRELPIVMVTARQDWETRLAAYESGADDYLSKPIVNAELVVKCKAWIERSRRRSVRFDPVTDLMVHSVFAEQSTRMLSMNVALGFTLFKITNLKEINEVCGPAEGDVVLAALASLLNSRFRPDALRGRWSGSELSLLVRYADKSSYQRSVLRFVEEFAEVASVFKTVPEISVGVAFDGPNIYSIARAARGSALLCKTM